MSFLLTCPNCGARQVGEFHFHGEVRSRPAADAPMACWVSYVYMRRNIRGAQAEWWHHVSGCDRWFVVERDTCDNTSHRSRWFSEWQREQKA